MATTLARLVLKIGADVSGVTAGMNTLDRRTRKLKKQFGSVTDSTLSWQKSLGLLAGAAGLGFAAKRILEFGANVEETANKFNVVMGPAADDMRERIQKLTDTVPLMGSELEKMSAGVQDLLVPLGFVREEAAGMSVDMVALAGDLASFNNVAADIPLDAIKSALAGQSRPLRQFGVDVSAARLEALALSEGIIKVGESFDASARAQAVMLAVQLDSSDAMGDAARTADSAANQMRFFTRDVKQLGEDFAVALVPAIQEFITEGSGGLQFLETFAAEMKNQAPVIAAWAKFTIEAGKFAAKAFAAPIRIAFNLGQVIGDLALIVGSLAVGDFAGAAEAAKMLAGDFGDMKDVVTGLVDSFGDMQLAAGDAFMSVPEDVKTATAAMREFGAVVEETKQGIGSGIVAPVTIEIAGADSALQGGGLAAGIDSQVEEIKVQMENIRTSGTSVAGSLASGFTNAFEGLISRTKDFGDAFSDLAKSVIADLTRMIAKALAFRFVASFIPGFAPVAAGVQFAGGFAHGGRIPSGQFGLVAEAGRPEIVSRPSLVAGPAQVTPTGGGRRGEGRAIMNEVRSHMSRIGRPMTTREASRDAELVEIIDLVTRRLDETN